MIELIFFCLAGVASGIVFGLVPGTHINNLLPLILSFSLIFPSAHALATFIVALSIAQTLVSYIPSVFLGAPNEETALSVLPGHRLLLAGRGYEAIKLTVLASLFSILLTLALVAILSNHFVWLYEVSRPYIQYPILAVILFMAISEHKPSKISFALFIILLSGAFGVVVLGSSLVPQKHVLFPVLAGMFGVSTLLISLKEKSRIPEQIADDTLKIHRTVFLKSITLGSVFGILVGFLPAIGVSQAATIAQYLGSMGEARAFLATLASINLANEVFSLNSLYLVGNPRSGASVAIQRILPELNFFDVLLLTGATCFSSGISSLAALWLGKRIPRYLAMVNYTYMNLAIILFITLLVLFLTGIFGILTLFVATSVGLLCIQLGVRRSNCMGTLLIPSLLFFTGLNPTILSFLGI